MGNAVVTRSEMNQGSSRVMVTHISSPFPLQGLAQQLNPRNRSVIEISPMLMLQLMNLIIERPVTPPPIRKSENITVPFHLHKDTIKLVPSEKLENVYYINFQFDAREDCSVRIHIAWTEEQDDYVFHETRFRPTTSFFTTPILQKFKPGLSQNYPSMAAKFYAGKLGNAVCLMKKVDVYPIIIELAPTMTTNFKAQVSYVYCKKSGKQYQAVCELQKLFIDDDIYEQNDIFGLDEKSKPLETFRGENDKCVICLEKDKNTMVMPCRHFWLCDECAEESRQQQNRKCPMCRQHMASLLKFDNEKVQAMTARGKKNTS